MSCAPWDPTGCASDIAKSVAGDAFSSIAHDFGTAAAGAIDWLWSQIQSATAVSLQGRGFDLDIGIGILRKINAPKRLAVPVLVHIDYDERIPGACDTAQARVRRLASAIEARYGHDVGPAGLVTQGVVRARGRSRLELVEPAGEDQRSVLPSAARPKEAHR